MPAALTAAGAQYRYIWTSRNQSTFTANDLRFLGSDEAVVIIEKTHDHAHVAGADHDAASIAAGPGKPKVLFNLTTRAAVNAVLKQFGKAFQDGWILRDASGNKIADNSSQGRGRARTAGRSTCRIRPTGTSSCTWSRNASRPTPAMPA